MFLFIHSYMNCITHIRILYVELSMVLTLEFRRLQEPGSGNYINKLLNPKNKKYYECREMLTLRLVILVLI